jgi:hypothetical protein
MIKYIPHFIKLIKTGDILNIKVISSYLLLNTISGIISLWIISRMVIISNLGDLYVISLTVGLFISIYLYILYNKNITELNYNIRTYPLWMLSIFGFILFSLWIVLPYSFIKIMENYSDLLDKYNIYLNHSVKMSMSNSPDSDNVSTTVRSNIQNPESIMKKEIPRGISKSISNTNSITNIVSTSTDTDAGDGGVAKAMSSASLSNKIDVSSSQAPTNSQGNDILDTNPLLNVKTEKIPLVFANPSNVSYVDDVYHDNIPPYPYICFRIINWSR